MDLVIDSDVKAVAEFMQSHFAASRLVSVAQAMARLAPILWGRYPPEEIDALMLAHHQFNGSAISRPVATGSAPSRFDAGGDSGAGGDVALRT